MSSISTRIRRSVALGAALMLLLGACGGDDDDGTDASADGIADDGDSTDQGGEDPSSDQASTQGQGVLVLDGQRFVTDIVICDLDGPGDDPTDFSYAGIGTLDGTPFAINATIGIIGDGGSATIIDGLTVVDEAGTAALYETAADTADRVPSEFSIDGRDVFYEAEFVGADGETSVGRGTFEVTCS